MIFLAAFQTISQPTITYATIDEARTAHVGTVPIFDITNAATKITAPAIRRGTMYLLSSSSSSSPCEQQGHP